MTAICPICGDTFECLTGDYNRAAKLGYAKACGGKCGAKQRQLRFPRGPARGTPEGVAAKAAYDARRREDPELRERRRTTAAKWYREHHDEALRGQAAKRADPKYRERMAAYQREHSRTPEWREHKRGYDRMFHAVRDVGEDMAPAVVALIELNAEIRKMFPSREERAVLRADRYGRAQRRKRQGRRHDDGD